MERYHQVTYREARVGATTRGRTCSKTGRIQSVLYPLYPRLMTSIFLLYTSARRRVAAIAPITRSTGDQYARASCVETYVRAGQQTR